MSGPVHDADAAEARVRSFVTGYEAAETDEDWRRARELVRERRLPPSAERISRAEYRARLERAAGDGADELALHGSLARLGEEGECWAVHYAGLLSGGLTACVDVESGAVLYLAITPEG